MIGRRSLFLTVVLVPMVLLMQRLTTAPPPDRWQRLGGAIANGDVETVRWLLDAGLPPDGPSPEPSWYPLHMAAMSGQDGVVRLLLDRGAKVDRNTDRGTPLEEAARGGHPSTVKLLLERGAVEKARQWRLNSALWEAATQGQVEVARVLLQHGADPNCKQAGESVLHAVQVVQPRRKAEMAALLKRAGAQSVSGMPE